MINAGSLNYSIQQLCNERLIPQSDLIAVEEPLEIRLSQKTIAITMRTPGHDSDLAVGFLFSEGIIRHRDDLKEVKPCGPKLNQAQSQNIVRVELQQHVSVDLKKLERHFTTHSSCGLCGKTSIDFFCTQIHINRERAAQDLRISSAQLCQLPDQLRSHQSLFQETGGLHASALFTRNGELTAIREDVGRHNALDKIIGNALLQGQIPLLDSVLLVSGRVSFELVQKAAMAGIPILAAVGAPSSLAIEFARKMGITLTGFIKKNRLNVYSGEWRIM